MICIWGCVAYRPQTIYQYNKVMLVWCSKMTAMLVRGSTVDGWFWCCVQAGSSDHGGLDHGVPHLTDFKPLFH